MRNRGGRLGLVRWQRWALLLLEAACGVAIVLVVVIAAMGRVASWLSGSGGARELVSFSAGVLATGLAVAALLRGWLAVRSRLARLGPLAPTATAVAAACVAGWLASGAAFRQELQGLQTLVGGPAIAARTAVAHQVFAAYRRLDLDEMEIILERARVYEPTIHEAALAFDVDAEILVGLASTESSFHPRPSKDGGNGLFQITQPPREALEAARKRLGKTRLDPANQRHNAFVGAATLRRYLDQMNGDLFLGLLAYNIGPRNGGLQTIMHRYGARDFVTIQPYLKNLPREYPIRVLSAALAYRLWRTEGGLPRYEEGDNARRVQAVGIPGLESIAASLASAG